jgi:hypothetical protein
MLEIGYVLLMNEMPTDRYLSIINNYLTVKYPLYIRKFLNREVQLHFTDIIKISNEKVINDGEMRIEKLLWNSYDSYRLSGGKKPFIIVTDLDHQRLSKIAYGINYLNQDWAWAVIEKETVINTSQLFNKWYVTMQGIKGNGLAGLVTIVHELTHTVLNKYYGIKESLAIDGRELSGQVILDDNWNYNKYGKWFFQRVNIKQPYMKSLGSYHVIEHSM